MIFATRFTPDAPLATELRLSAESSSASRTLKLRIRRSRIPTGVTLSFRLLPFFRLFLIKADLLRLVDLSISRSRDLPVLKNFSFDLVPAVPDEFVVVSPVITVFLEFLLFPAVVPGICVASV